MHSPFCCLRNNNTYFVLTGCNTSVLIADVHASVLLSQKFQNPSSSDSLSATYTFGLIASAAICGFEMIRADGTKVEGLVKEKTEAKKEYDAAIKQGYTASLGQEETKDVFSISVGNIEPSETVTINLRYLQTLTDDEKRDQIRFYFPRTYVQRYGSAPSHYAAMTQTAHQPFTMDVIIQQANSIKGVSCPSGHPIQLELGKPDGFTIDASVTDSQMAKVSLRDDSGYLTQDIIIVITATNLDNPRCFIEPHPSPNEDSLAMGLTLVPRFQLPDVEGGMEYIFLVDRSGSMGGQSIKLVREALIVLLRGLPTKGTTFNIVSFGSRAKKLWETSQVYSQHSLEKATKHIDSMEADYGGTEIASALDLVFSSLSKPLDHCVSVFLLTDGGAWDVSNCVLHTTNARKLPTKNNFLRVFTVGIGNGASTDTCDSIARAGEGISVYVGPNEAMIGKCARLVRAARNPPLKDLEVSWLGNGKYMDDLLEDFDMVDDDVATLAEEEPKEPLKSSSVVPISLFNTEDAQDAPKDVGPPDESKITLPQPPKVQQGPFKIPTFVPGSRSQIYAIISGKHSPIPSSITVRGTVSTTGAIVELSIPVVKLITPLDSSSSAPLLHSLAAKALITDRENKTYSFPQSTAKLFVNNLALEDVYLKKDIIRLGITYHLSSRHTSFVAVDKRKNIYIVPPSGDGSVSSSDEEAGSPVHWRSSGTADGSRSRKKRGRGSFSPSVPPTGRSLQAQATGMAPGSYGAIQVGGGGEGDLPLMGGGMSKAKKGSGFPGLQKFFGSTSAKPSAPPPRKDASRRSSGRGGGPINFSESSTAAPDSSISPSAPPAMGLFSSHIAPSAPPPPPAAAGKLSSPSAAPHRFTDSREEDMPSEEGLTALARLQKFDGGFRLERSLLQLIGLTDTIKAIKEKCSGLGLNDDALATLLALAWLTKNTGDESLDIQEKSTQWLEDLLGDRGAVENSTKQVLQLVPIN